VTIQLGDDDDCFSVKSWTKKAQWSCGEAALSVSEMEVGEACAKNRYESVTATCCTNTPPQCAASHAGSPGACRTEAQWTSYATHRCAQKEQALVESLPLWACEGGFRYIRFTCCADLPPLDPCDDGAPLVCDMEARSCGDDSILSVQGGCYSCVNPWTCAPPCEAGAAWDDGLSACCPTAPLVAECGCEPNHKSVDVDVLDEAGCLVEESCDCVPCEDGESCFDACASAPCLSGGTCASVDGVATCACAEGFDGGLCEGCAPGFEANGDGCNPCPTCPGSPWPDWELEDIEPSSPGYQDTYGLAALPSSVTVVTLLVGW